MREYIHRADLVDLLNSLTGGDCSADHIRSVTIDCSSMGQPHRIVIDHGRAITDPRTGKVVDFAPQATSITVLEERPGFPGLVPGAAIMDGRA